MSEPCNPHPKGFVGTTDRQLALRPLFFKPNRNETLDEVIADLRHYGIISRAFIKRPHEEELLLDHRFKDEIISWAKQREWEILPEMHELVRKGPRKEIMSMVEERSLRLMPAILPKSLPRFNLAAVIAPLIPAKLSTQLRAEAGGRCECCGRVKGIETAQCEPIWKMKPKPDVDVEIEKPSGIAELVALEILCTDCSAVTHFSAGSRKNYASLEHLALVNGIQNAEAEDMIQMANDESRNWSRQDWTYDTIELHRYFEMDPPGSVPLSIDREL